MTTRTPALRNALRSPSVINVLPLPEAGRGDDDGLSQPGSPAGAPCTSRAGCASRRRLPTTTMAGVGGSLAATKSPSPAERRGGDLLVRHGGVGDDGDGVIRCPAARHQRGGDFAQMLHRHVHDDHRRGQGNGAPVDVGRHVAGGVMAGEEDHGMVGIAVGGGHAGIGQAANAGRDAGHDPEGNAGWLPDAGIPRRRART